MLDDAIFAELNRNPQNRYQSVGTRELEQRIGKVRLDRVVSHRTLILPQLGAPGVSAPHMKDATGFRAKYGHVRARDLPAYLSAGQKKNDEMRRVYFRLANRLAIAPLELVQAWPIVLGVICAAALLGLPFGLGYFGVSSKRITAAFTILQG